MSEICILGPASILHEKQAFGEFQRGRRRAAGGQKSGTRKPPVILVEIIYMDMHLIPLLCVSAIVFGLKNEN